MALSDFAGGVNNAIQQILARRMQEQALAQQTKQQEFQNSLRTRELDEQSKYRAMQQQGLNDAREQAAADQKFGVGKILADTIPDGTDLALDSQAVPAMREGGQGDLLKERYTLGSTQMAGAMPTPGPVGGQGFLRTTTSTPQLRGYLKTASQSQLATAADDARHAEAARQVAADRAADHARDERRDRETERNNRAQNAIASINAGRERTTTTRPLPSRVQGYLLDLRARHGAYDDALREMQRTFATAPDETFDRLDAATKLRQLYAQPSGVSDFEQQFGSFGGPDILGGGSRPDQPPRQASNTRRAMANTGKSLSEFSRVGFPTSSR